MSAFQLSSRPARRDHERDGHSPAGRRGQGAALGRTIRSVGVLRGYSGGAGRHTLHGL
jgi:hypothetical protein